MTKTTFKKMITSLTREELNNFLLTTFDDNKAFREIISAELSSDDEKVLFDKYYKRLDRLFHLQSRFSLSEVKGVIEEYEGKTSNKALIAEINFYFAKNAAEFTAMYGDIDGEFYDALESAAEVAFSYAREDKDWGNRWYDELEMLVNDCGDFGWGVEDNLREELYRLESVLDSDDNWSEDEASDDEGSDDTGISEVNEGAVEVSQESLPYQSTQLAEVHNIEVARQLFEEYGVPYNVYERGENKGKLRVLKLRDQDGREFVRFKKTLNNHNLSWVYEHGRYYRKGNNQGIVMFFSPYASDEEVDKLEGRIIDGYRLTVRDESIYGMSTKTIVAEYAFGTYR